MFWKGSKGLRRWGSTKGWVPSSSPLFYSLALSPQCTLCAQLFPPPPLVQWYFFKICYGFSYNNQLSLSNKNLLFLLDFITVFYMGIRNFRFFFYLYWNSMFLIATWWYLINTVEYFINKTTDLIINLLMNMNSNYFIISQSHYRVLNSYKL